MNFSKPFIDRPIATSLVMAAIFLAGVVAFFQLPVAVLPNVEFPTIQVSASLPGADPETMASSVATPLERQFAQIPHLQQMTSVSTLNDTSIALQFELDREIDAAAQDVSAAINAAGGQLPKNLPNPPRYNKTNPADPPIFILGLYSEVLPLDQVNQYADTMAQQVSQISGVGLVGVTGEQKAAIRVQIDPEALAATGLSLEDVRTVLAQTSINSPKGTLNGLHQAASLASNDQLTRAEDYRNVIVAYRNGAPLRISDIGTAVDGVENNQVAGWTSHRRGIMLTINRQPGANAIETVNLINARLERLAASLPPAVTLMVINDKTKMIRASVADIEFTLSVSIVLVIMVIFLFLRKFYATLICGLAVPMSLVGTFGVMHLCGYSLDNLSLMALTIAVGFVVDDTIVMIENIVRRMEEGETPYEAAVNGARQIGFTIISITVSLIAVFIPLLLMGGVVGRLFHEFAVTLSVAVLISAFVSLTLTPTMCARLLARETEHHGRFYDAADRFFTDMTARYERGLKLALSHRTLTLWIFAGTLVLTGVLFTISPKGFFPIQDTGLIIASAEATQDISYADMMKKVEQANEIILADPAVFSSNVSAGAGSRGGNMSNTARLGFALKPFAQRDSSADEVIARLRPKLAAIPGLSVRLVSSQDITVGARAAKAQFQYTLQGQDITELNAWGKVMFKKISDIKKLTDVSTDQQDAGSRLMVKVDRNTASRLGILSQQIDDTLSDAFGQRQVATIFTQLDQYHVILEVDPRVQQSPDALSKIYVKSASGAQVPLSAFASFERTTAPLVVSHQGQFPALTISFNLASGVALSEAIDLVKEAEREAHLPPSVIPTFQGTAQAFQASLVSMPWLIAAAIVAVYIVLGILYESYIHPLTILSTIPSAGVGALLMLRGFGYPLDMIGLIGIILLIGIVKKNAIMMIDFALEAERLHGMAPEESIYHAALTRFRPIMMTTMAALFSGIPLMVMKGAGAELRQPLGYAIVGGLILSQMLTLFTTPVVYLALSRFATAAKPSRLQKLMTAANPSPAE